jgi:bifunctional DNA-binding transcriptional regulator/antitoxin component of YhaV-PrlF toxin-antitoxin module
MAMTDSRSFLAPVTSDGDIQIPEEARAMLKLEGIKEVAIIVDKHGVHFVPLKMTLEDVRGSVPGIAGVSEDLDVEIEQAIEDAILEKYG